MCTPGCTFSHCCARTSRARRGVGFVEETFMDLGGLYAWAGVYVWAQKVIVPWKPAEVRVRACAAPKGWASTRKRARRLTPPFARGCFNMAYALLRQANHCYATISDPALIERSALAVLRFQACRSRSTGPHHLHLHYTRLRTMPVDKEARARCV